MLIIFIITKNICYFYASAILISESNFLSSLNALSDYKIFSLLGDHKSNWESS